MLEPVYALAPDLLRSGRVVRPASDTANTAATREARMTDFRLLRYGGFYHAVARYGPDVWTPFTYAGLHASERVLRRKEQHRFWGVDCYSHEEDRYLQIGNRLFYEDPDQEVEPSAQVVVASDPGPGGGGSWARELAQSTLSGDTPTLFCTPDGQCSEAVELRPSRDLVSDPAGHPTVGRPEGVNRWLRDNPDMAAIDGRTAHRLFMTVCQFPAMRATWLAEMVKGSPREVLRHLRRFVETGLVAVFDGRHYLSEPGMKRAANMSRVLPGIIKSRHEAYLDRWYREHEQWHNDGVNRLVVQFAREGVEVVAGWRGELNVPGLTQVRPDLLVPVREGPYGEGFYFQELERHAVQPFLVAHKLGPYRRMAGAGRPLPLLVVCETEQGEEGFRAAAATAPPMLSATQERALSGPLTGPALVRCSSRCRRALAMTRAAWEANITRVSSSSRLNSVPGSLLATLILPTPSPRWRMGAARKELTGTGRGSSGRPSALMWPAKSPTRSGPGRLLRCSKNLKPSGSSHSWRDSSALRPETRKSSACPSWPRVVMRE